MEISCQDLCLQSARIATSAAFQACKQYQHTGLASCMRALAVHRIFISCPTVDLFHGFTLCFGVGLTALQAFWCEEGWQSRKYEQSR